MNPELNKKLEELAYKRTSPFCYSCYAIAPTGRCLRCGSDDLMRHMEGVGVEYGTDWVIRHLVEEECTPLETDQVFEDSIRECYPETIDIGWLKNYDLVTVRELDPVAWDMARSEYIDSLESDDMVMSFDGGSTYYYTTEIEALE